MKYSNEGLTNVGKNLKPPTLDELNAKMEDVRNSLWLWQTTISKKLPTFRDKEEFYRVISGLPSDIDRLIDVYEKLRKELESAAKYQLDLPVNPSGLENPDFAKWAKVIKNLPKMRRRWW